MKKTTNKTISRILGVAAILGMTTGAIATQKKLSANDPNGTGATTSSGSVKKNENLTLNQAVQRGKLDIVKQLLNNGVDINLKEESGIIPLSNGNTALHVAAFANEKEIAKFLIKKGAEVNIRNKFASVTPLHWASMNGFDEMVDILIQNGANVNIKTIQNGLENETPLHWATMLSADFKVIKTLVKNGADVNARDMIGQTPLHNSLSGGVDLHKLLISLGADKNIKDETGETALDYAKEYGFPEIVKYYEDNDSVEQKKIDFSANQNNKSVSGGVASIKKIAGDYVTNNDQKPGSLQKSTDEHFNKLRKKSESFKSNTLVFKGLYLGMPIKDAQYLINHYLNYKQVSSEPIVAKKPKSEAEQLQQLFTDNSKDSFKIYKAGQQLLLRQGAKETPIATSSPDGSIYQFKLSKKIRDRLFNSQQLSENNFLSTFREAYNLPPFEQRSFELKVLFEEIGHQPYLQHQSEKGFAVSYFDKPWAFDQAKLLFSNKVEEGTILIYRIKKKQDIRKSFD